MKKPILLLLLVALSGCQGLTDFLNALPAPTPQEECFNRGGRWQTIITYDVKGNPSPVGECVIRK